MKIYIIGAGITGLSAAYFLGQKGHEIEMFEKSSEIGGLAGIFNVNGEYLEKYYHHSFMSHTDVRQLMYELGIAEELVFRRARMGFYGDGEIYPFTTPGELLRFKPLNIVNRIRLGFTSLLMMRLKDWQNLESTSALSWLRRYSGNEVCRIIWEPLLKGKFGDDYESISAAWLWNRVVDRRKNAKGRDVLGYINGGYKRLFDKLVEAIKKNGGKIERGWGVDRIKISNGQCKGVYVQNNIIEGDVVVSTVPLPVLREIAPDLPKSYLARLLDIKYQGSICVVLALPRNLSDFYWINVSDPNYPFVGIIEHTNFIPSKVYGSQHLVYLTRYASSSSPIFQQSDESIFNEFVRYLRNIFLDFSEFEVKKYWVFRDRFSQPVFVRDYSRVMPAQKTPIENLYVLNTSQIYPESRSINSSVRLAKEFAEEIS